MADVHPAPQAKDLPLPAVDALARVVARADEMANDDDEADARLLELVESREEDYRALSREIASSSELLTSLTDFLGKFQVDLSSVSGELQDLRERSLAIERRGGGRRTIEKPLSALVDSITIPPELVTLVLDTAVSDAWFPAVDTLDALLVEVDRRKGRVRAVAEVERVAEGLKNSATTKIRAHLLALLRPLTASVTTNVPILQTSVILRHRPLYLFLLAQARPIALEVRRAYVWRARGYFETSFRRYARTVGEVAARNTDAYELLGATPSAAPAGGVQSLLTAERALRSSTSGASSPADSRPPSAMDLESSVVRNARIEGEGVLLSWQADDKSLRLPVEACFRSLMLVLLDNASSEYTFLVRFFSPPSASPRPGTTADRGRSARLFSTASTVGDDPPPARRDRFDSYASLGGRTERLPSYVGALPAVSEGGRRVGVGEDKEEIKEMETLWGQVFGPALEYVQAQITAFLTPVPSPPHLLSLLTLLSALLATAQSRGITPLETFLIKQRLALWPAFQKRMDDEVASVRKLAELAAPGGGGLLGMVGVGASKVKDAKVERIAERYISMFNALTALSSEVDGPMISMSLARLRAVVAQLITAQAARIASAESRAAFSGAIYDRMVAGLRLAFDERLRAGEEGAAEEVGGGTDGEIRFWRNKAKSD